MVKKYVLYVNIDTQDGSCTIDDLDELSMYDLECIKEAICLEMEYV